MGVRYFDAAREQFRELAADDRVHGCCMAVTVVVTKDGCLLECLAHDEDRPEPYTMMGALMSMIRHIEDQFVERE